MSRSALVTDPKHAIAFRGAEEKEFPIRSQTPCWRRIQVEEIGAYCAFLCSVHAGYITAQNLLIDGGAYPGTY